MWKVKYAVRVLVFSWDLQSVHGRGVRGAISLSGLAYTYIQFLLLLLLHYQHVVQLVYNLLCSSPDWSDTSSAITISIQCPACMPSPWLAVPGLFALCRRRCRCLWNCRLIKYQPHCWWSVIFIERVDSTCSYSGSASRLLSLPLSLSFSALVSCCRLLLL